MTDHRDFADQVGSYLLGALPADELEAFEHHLEACERCRADVASLSLAVGALPDAAPAVLPPPGLRDRIMRVVDSEAELLRAAGPEADRPARAPRRGRATRRRRLGTSAWPRAAVAWSVAGALALGLAVGVLATGGDEGPAARTISAQVDTARAPGASATLHVRGGAATLDVAGMDNPPGRRVYQVWVQERGSKNVVPTNALFTAAGNGTASVRVPGDASRFARVMVTAEPFGGSPQPTSEPLIVANAT
jgi:anti-sigma factor RsiW